MQNYKTAGKKPRITRIIGAILIFALIISLFTSCGDEKATDTESGVLSGSSAETAKEAENTGAETAKEAENINSESAEPENAGEEKPDDKPGAASDETEPYAAEHTVRTTPPDKTDRRYYSADNAYYPSFAPYPGSGKSLGNCTWYVFGRVAEYWGITLPRVATAAGNSFRGNAATWWSTNKAGGIYEYGDLPEPGAIAVWDGPHGHVAFVEAVENGEVFYSQSSMACEEYPDGLLFLYGKFKMDGFLGYIYPNKPKNK